MLPIENVQFCFANTHNDVCFVDCCLSFGPFFRPLCCLFFVRFILKYMVICAFENHLQFQVSLLAQCRWFSPGTPASSTTKTGRHDIAEILLKVALKYQQINQSINQSINQV
jgi:hypothetical protein